MKQKSKRTNPVKPLSTYRPRKQETDIYVSLESKKQCSIYMKTIEVEVELMKFFGIRRNLIVPNISDWNRWLMFEADLLVLSQSGYATAIEIKVSKNDLKADLKKKHIKNLDSILFKNKPPLEFYYGNLKHFYYAVPKQLIESAKEQIPDFCGLIMIDPDPKHKSQKTTIVRKPKLLFNKKWSEKMRYDVARLGAMRILGLKESILNHQK